MYLLGLSFSYTLCSRIILVVEQAEHFISPTHTEQPTKDVDSPFCIKGVNKLNTESHKVNNQK